MFTRFFALLSLALLVIAVAPQCEHSKPYCCDLAFKPDDSKVLETIESLNINDAIVNWILSGLSSITSDSVGLECSPLEDTSADCHAVPLCCAQEFGGGLLNAFCTNITADN